MYGMNESVAQVFANRLKKLRMGKGLTQQQLGEKLGVSRGSISFYENCDRVPDIEFLQSTAKFFDVSISFLLGEEQEEDTYSKAFLLASEHFELSPDSLRHLYELSKKNQSRIIDAILSSMEIHTTVGNIEKAVYYYQKYLNLAPERIELEFQLEEGSADEEYIAAVLDEPENYCYACVPMEDVADYYTEKAVQEFRLIVQQIRENEEVPTDGNDNQT